MKKNAEIVLGGFVLDTPAELGKERVGHIRNHDADESRRALDESPRRHTGHVTEFGRYRLDALIVVRRREKDELLMRRIASVTANELTGFTRPP